MFLKKKEANYAVNLCPNSNQMKAILQLPGWTSKLAVIQGIKLYSQNLGVHIIYLNFE